MVNVNFDVQHFETFYPPDARFEDIEKALSYIKSGNSVQLISLPGVGRSNAMGLLSYNREARTLHLGSDERWFHFVMMNFAEIKGRPLLDATKYMLLELANSFEERKMEDEYAFVRKALEDGLRGNDEMVLFQSLKKSIDFLCLEKKYSVVFLFDRFGDYVPMVDEKFFSNLRVLRDRAKYKFSCIFPLNRPLEELVGPDIISDYYEFVVGNTVYMPLMDEKILNFRLKFIQENAGKKLSESLIKEITELTAGTGKLTRICMEAIISKNSEVKNLSDFLLSNNKVTAVLNEIWNSLTPYEQNLIEENNTSESSHLVAVGLIKNNKIAIPLFEDYVKNRNKSGEVQSEKITFNPDTKEIKKGGLVVSDLLTSSEYKLLKFMVENEGKILDRDEIINAVWKDLSSTAGVSEQALDQLIFRLRKKIEENPNSPIYLQTVKGRGFKFVS